MIDDKRLELEAMWFDLDTPRSLMRVARNSSHLGYRDIQSVLDRIGRSVAVVEFFVQSESVRVFVLRSGGTQPKVVEWPCSEERLQYLLNSYRRELLEYPRYGTDQRWQALASPLIQKLVPELEGAELIYLIPNGLFTYLPLHALRTNGTHLIDQCPIAYAPSADVFTRTLERSLNGEPRKLRTVLVAGNPTFDLEHAEDEAKWVANYFGVRPYLGREATKVRIQSDLPEKDLIHLACHGFFHANDPLESGLRLAGKRVLSVRDIGATRITAELVTLSACESGLNDPLNPSARGLSRAFLESGASAVLGTLWPVADETTTLFMSFFYQFLYDSAGSKIKTKAEALQQAMLTLRKQKEHPYYWAAYRLMGSWQ